MDLRLATKDDLYQCANMMKNFIASTQYNDLLDVNYCIDFARRHLSNPDGLTVVLDDAGLLKGMFAGVVSMHPFIPVLSTCELCWWVEPDARNSRKGLELLKAYEYWAIHVKKAKFITLGSLADEKVDRIYQRMGYTKSEHQWTKRV